jgi:hypothetical protein
MWKTFTDENPPERTQILISGFIDNREDRGRWVEAAWYSDFEFFTNEDLMDEKDPGGFYEPSHWMPLPAPPTE